ncbi:MAG: hypothetical protein ACUVV3_07950 [Dehalococcoidia bacterium]
MAGRVCAPWYVMAALRLIDVMLACLAALMALRVGGVIGWTGFGLGAFAMFEMALWADWQWPEMRGRE